MPSARGFFASIRSTSVIETIVGRTGAMIFILANVLQLHHSS
jgi:hypothetical protein